MHGRTDWISTSKTASLYYNDRNDKFHETDILDESSSFLPLVVAIVARCSQKSTEKISLKTFNSLCIVSRAGQTTCPAFLFYENFLHYFNAIFFLCR